LAADEGSTPSARATPPRDSMDDEDNGLLAGAPGQYIAQAARSLLEPAASLRERVSAVIDADRRSRSR